MKKHFVVLCAAAILTLAAGTALADSIGGRLGVTGRIGFIVPSDGAKLSTGVIGTNTDFIGGGGLIYGVTDNWTAELDVTHAGFGSNAGLDFDITDISLGVQYRFINIPVRHLVPFAGGGLDILLNDASGGNSIDDTVGLQLKTGIDYFLQRQLAFTAEVKGVLAPDVDINEPDGEKKGDFDPTSFSMTFGIRYFFY